MKIYCGDNKVIKLKLDYANIDNACKELKKTIKLVFF